MPHPMGIFGFSNDGEPLSHPSIWVCITSDDGTSSGYTVAYEIQGNHVNKELVSKQLYSNRR